MSNVAIRAEDISKAYQLGQIGTGTISRDLERWYARIRGKEDPFLRIGEANDRSSKGSSDIVWSLKDINFEIEQGDAVGIIGRNGAGKSTLLKILSKVTAPTTGKITGKGRIASLLEVGTGFHPELSGRENIFLNGAILGMRKKEIQRKLEEIVDFAGIERYLDTPVKRYSSGMYVRLAFAVAAHLESEILIVDEVLAVGDAEFQKKCLGKMGEVSKGEGRTVLFVSHNMGSIAKLCSNALLLENGQVKLYANTSKTIIEYNRIASLSSGTEYTGIGIIKKIKITSEHNDINYGSSIIISTFFQMDIPISNITLGLVIKDSFGTSLIGVNNRHYQSQPIHETPLKQGVINVKIKNINLIDGNYNIDIFLGNSIIDLEIIENAVSFTVSNSYINKTNHPLDPSINKLFLDNIAWEYEKI
ncbi:ABC transporter ATP-binding protein [Pedobacter rhizosphaerae]|uniref:Lipopolysaccharide transport system ATP-binding protein n=1 Tax=Pedobacter rhizosphaerae TaxID=390241 RepID=A0A1H9N784_9SPHI|nr:ABC transporter ATP-binding protein [Pedobacter rhizosphaerae]SER31748.1 lipopolysaccharide transport system ATP-binding protein [Pedobacter rhizosphaerae]